MGAAPGRRRARPWVAYNCADVKKFLSPLTGPGFVILSVVALVLAALVIAALQPLRDGAREVLVFQVPVWGLVMAAGTLVVLYVVRGWLSPPQPSRNLTVFFGSKRLRRWGVDWVFASHPDSIRGPLCPDDGTPLWQSLSSGPRSPESESSRIPGNPWQYLRSDELRFECITCRGEFDLSAYGDMQRLLREVHTVGQAHPRTPGP